MKSYACGCSANRLIVITNIGKLVSCGFLKRRSPNDLRCWHLSTTSYIHHEAERSVPVLFVVFPWGFHDTVQRGESDSVSLCAAGNFGSAPLFERGSFWSFSCDVQERFGIKRLFGSFEHWSILLIGISIIKNADHDERLHRESKIIIIGIRNKFSRVSYKWIKDDSSRLLYTYINIHICLHYEIHRRTRACACASSSRRFVGNDSLPHCTW